MHILYAHFVCFDNDDQSETKIKQTSGHLFYPHEIAFVPIFYFFSFNQNENQEREEEDKFFLNISHI